jgi:enediyne biosynthesis protein E4
MHVPLHFGLKENSADSVKIIWPDGRTQRLFNVKADQKITINYSDAHQVTILSQQQARKKIFSPNRGLINYVNEEDDYNDFKRQPLMPNMISYCGPRCAKADVNSDGLEDLYFCGAKDYAGKIFIQAVNGNFKESNQPELAKDSAFDDADALFFDADGDGDKDLYVVSGSYNVNADDTLLQDRIYFNETGNFVKRRNALPKEFSSGSCVRAADVDGDGDMDLFVGGRVVPGRYPEVPESFILINDGKGNFRNATESIAPVLKNIGMVTDAVWIDLNKDHQPDLAIVGEWIPVKFFINNHGKLVDESSTFLKNKSSGWWNRIYADDFDHDGDTDLVIGNIGLNCQMKVNEKEPAEIFSGDFDKNGSVDPFIFYYIQDSLSPMASRDEALDQMISLRRKFTSYDQYAHASLKNILSEDQIQQAQKSEAVRFETSYLENENDHFEFKTLPAEAQFAPVFAITSLDYDGDGNKDLLLAGNMQHVRIRFGKYDANYGVLLKGDGKGNFTYVPQTESGLSVRGDVRDVVSIKNNSGNFILFEMNQQAAVVYKLNSK